ncbi:hypothetical protein GCM10009527_006180 [Actinomadura nitritigenes]|uniref:hypothetical protein n=1 Tax=Actinomadura nitritigenes TaxID=134602 RepID=UPI001FB7C8B7|nr:hypothetical protein [Actinomadura nitritigenes]
MGIRVIVVAGAVLFGAVACGGGGDGDGVASAGGAAAKASASPSRSLSPEDAQLKFAQCMRQNGVDVPDPGSGHAETMRIGKGAGREKLQAAMKECQSWLQAGGKMPDLKDPKVRDQYVKFAQCMREHGIDVKDPDPDGTIQIPTGKVDPEAVKKAREACKALVPGSGK